MICTFNDEQFLLSTDKVLIHMATHTGFIADVHLGKSAHFRKAGIAIPTNIIKEDLSKIAQVIQQHELLELYFLGDLFHSDLNQEWKAFLNFLHQASNTKFTLIKGNHDILSELVYDIEQLKVVAEPFRWHNFILTHHPLQQAALANEPNLFNLAGHIHPGKVIKGKARSAIKLPCFLERKQQLILPAFGRFTGLVSDNAKENLKYHLLSPNSVFTIP